MFRIAEVLYICMRNVVFGMLNFTVVCTLKGKAFDPSVPADDREELQSSFKAFDKSWLLFEL